MAGVGLKPIPLMPSPSSPSERWISWPVISESCQVRPWTSGLVEIAWCCFVGSGLIEPGCLGDGGDESEVGSGGGGDRILLGLVLTIGLSCVVGVNDSVCLASGEDVGEDRVASCRQPGVSAISTRAPGPL